MQYNLCLNNFKALKYNLIFYCRLFLFINIYLVFFELIEVNKNYKYFIVS